ncbi:MAG: alpha/beta hydrolase [Chloroflexota bacterium]
MAVKTETQSIAAAAYTTNTVTSKDGTVISYRQLGHGPGVVLLHGSMESAQSHMKLAEGLANAFTVYLPERRGHSLKDVQGKAYSMQKEVEDLDALLTQTDTHLVFGVSAGGLIALQAALTLPNIHKIAVYEPALVVNHSIPMDLIARYDREIAEGKIAAALITGMKAGKMGPPIMDYMPRWLLEYFTTSGMKSEDKTAKPGDVTMRTLAPTLHYDFQLVTEMAETVNNFKALRPEVLLLGGSKSPKWLLTALDALEKALPHIKRVEFPGLDHSGSSDPNNMNRTGRPDLVAQEMRHFFA